MGNPARLAYLNGQFLPPEEACVSIFDRGFTYGDALFETIRIYAGRPFLFEKHMRRWSQGLHLLTLCSPLTPREIGALIATLLRRSGTDEGIIRLQITRGKGVRGYSPAGADHPTFCVTVHPPPETVRSLSIITSSWRLPEQDRLAAVKNCNKLRQVLARAEADAAAAHEALLLDSAGNVAEGTTSNVFWIEGETICTPPVARGILPGTTREFVLELCKARGIPIREKLRRSRDLLKMDGVFLTSVGLEIAAVSYLDGQRLKRSPLVSLLKGDYRKATKSPALDTSLANSG